MIKKISLALNLAPGSMYRRTKLVSTFLAGQGSLQLLQLVSGFLLVRWLSVEEYAQYNVAFAFQSTAQMLVEFGFSGAIIALVGSRIHDKKVIGSYIKAGQFYRNRIFLLVGAACIILFPLLTAKHGWSLEITIFLLFCILLNLYFSGNISYYISPLKIHKRLRDLYQIQVKNGLLRLLLIGLLYAGSVLNAGFAALTTSLLTIANGFAFKKKSNPFIEAPGSSSPEVRREMFNYIKPIMPGIIFAAFQTQVTVFLISVFGQTESIAEVGALGRLGQIFLILNVSGGTLVAPYFAQQKKKGLLLKYLYILGFAFVLSGAIVWTAYLYPNVLLWLLGAKYQHLQNELVIMVLNSGIGFIIGLMWSMNASRKWVFNWMPWVSIPGTLLVQLLCAWQLELDTTTGVLVFSTLTSLYVLLNRILVSIVGFRQLENNE